jgi:hypothetical protein
MSDRPPPIERPNGKLYRPRGVVAHRWENPDAPWADECGVIVIGTHDIERARPLATEAIQRWFDADMIAVRPVVDWYRLTYHYGAMTWKRDPVRGGAGVEFTADYSEDA